MKYDNSVGALEKARWPPGCPSLLPPFQVLREALDPLVFLRDALLGLIAEEAKVFDGTGDARANRSFHVNNVNAKTLRPILTQHADRKSILMTDGSIRRLAKNMAGMAP